MGREGHFEETQTIGQTVIEVKEDQRKNDLELWHIIAKYGRRVGRSRGPI